MDLDTESMGKPCSEAVRCHLSAVFEARSIRMRQESVKWVVGSIDSHKRRCAVLSGATAVTRAGSQARRAARIRRDTWQSSLQHAVRSSSGDVCHVGLPPVREPSACHEHGGWGSWSRRVLMPSLLSSGAELLTDPQLDEP